MSSISIDGGAEKARALQELLADATELTIVCHNNPDPDCLASAIALGRIAAVAGIDEQHILYSGSISHQQNRTFVNLLEIDLQPFDVDLTRNRPPDSLLAFVDHSVPTENNEVPEGTPLDIVIDHHSVEGDIDARFVDHREGLGATATILAEYLHALEFDVDSKLATALMFAIRRETLDFLHGTTRHEYAAAATLHDHVDDDLLRTLLTPAISGATIDAIAEAINNRLVLGATVITHVAHTDERDALPQAANYLARLEGVETVVVFGVVEDAIELSARSTDTRVHIGNALRTAFEDVGSAGGHREMAGGSIPLGIFADDISDPAPFLEVVEQVITNRLTTALQLDDPNADRAETDGSD